MAVMVVRQQCTCPNCNEFLSFTSADAKIVKKESRTTSYDAGKYIPWICTKTSWYITCPTCKHNFEVRSYSKLRKP